MASMPRMTIIFFCFVTLLLWHNVEAKGGGEITADPRMRLCGVEILLAHTKYCEQRKKRDLNGESDGKTAEVIQEKFAMSFLLKKTRQRRHLRNWYSNINEECCHETCSIEEVAEYRCL